VAHAPGDNAGADRPAPVSGGFSICLAERYWPVAVTLQFSVNVAVELAGSVGTVMPVAPCSKAIVVLPAAGQTAPPATDEQVTEVQLSPVTAGSRTVVPPARDGPEFTTVKV